MGKWFLILGLSGAAWMTFVLYRGSLLLAIVSNYPGMLAAQWVHSRGIAPSSATVYAWLVLTSALEWATVGIIAQLTARRFSK